MIFLLSNGCIDIICRAIVGQSQATFAYQKMPVRGHKRHLLPTVTECNAIPDNKDEIPTPDIAKAFPHLRPIADQIPEYQSDAEILLLVGRDVPPLHKVRESRNGKGNSPWAQWLELGWVILGNACLGGAHQTQRSYLLQNQPTPERTAVLPRALLKCVPRPPTNRTKERIVHTRNV